MASMWAKHEGTWSAGRGRAAAFAAVVAMAWGAGCGKDGGGEGRSPSNGGRGAEVLVDLPEQDGEPNGSSLPVAGPAGSAPEDPGIELPGAIRVGGEPRLVSAFDLEAQQPTPRVDGARGLGGACQTTAECQPGLGCANVIFSGVAESHIAGGYCSRWCEQDVHCEALEAGARCVVDLHGSELNLCVKPCLTGDEGEKCGGRHDLMCSSSAPGINSSCIPQCSGDADCSSGRCSAGHGLCDVRMPSPARPPGAVCQVSDSSSCNGVCSPSSATSDQGVCTGYCRLGSTCGPGAGTACAPREFGVREGDSGSCEPSCNSSEDCTAGYTACAPTGFLLPAGDPLKSCVQVYDQPMNLANQRLSVEQLALAAVPSSVINVSTSSIFEALSHRLSVEAGAVCVSGDMAGIEEFGAVLDFDFQFRPNNGSPLDAAGLSAFTFEAEGAHVVRFDAYVPGASYRYLTLPRAAGDVGEGPQRIEYDELFNIYSPADPPLSSLEAPQLEAVRFSLILAGASGPFRFCVRDLALQGPTATGDAGP